MPIFKRIMFINGISTKKEFFPIMHHLMWNKTIGTKKKERKGLMHSLVKCTLLSLGMFFFSLYK